MLLPRVMRSAGRILELARFSVAALAALATLAACHHAPRELPIPASTATVRFDPPPSYPDIVWVSSLDEARVRAAEEHKPMVVFIRAAWSKGSVDMETTVWKDDRVLAEARRFVCLRIDLTPQYDGVVPDSLKEFDIRSVPSTFVVSSTGQILGRFGEGKARSKDIAAAMRDAK